MVDFKEIYLSSLSIILWKYIHVKLIIIMILTILITKYKQNKNYYKINNKIAKAKQSVKRP